MCCHSAPVGVDGSIDDDDLSLSSHNVTAGTTVVFTATVTDQNSTLVTSGQVQFCDAGATYCEDAAVLGTAQLTSAGTASVRLRLGVGSHSVKAKFAGTNKDAGSVSGNQSVTVTGSSPSATALAASGAVGNYMLTATVMGGGKASPTGTVTFKDSSNANATVTTAGLDAQTAAAAFPLTSYSVGNYPYVAAVGDLNRDGKPDLVVPNLYDADVSVLLSNGDGTFQTQQTYPTGGSPTP